MQFVSYIDINAGFLDLDRSNRAALQNLCQGDFGAGSSVPGRNRKPCRTTREVLEMRFLNYTKMPFSFNEGWDEVGAVHPSVWKTLFLLVLPFSLIPPAMLLYAGSHHPAAYLIDAPFSRWQEVALVFLIAQLFTVPLMGWLIRNIAQVHKLSVDFKDAFLLAAIVAVPMWLSSLGLAIPSLWATIGIVVLGFLAAVSLLYHGTYSILKMEEQVEAQSMSFAAFSVGAIAWVLLCAFVVLPLMN